MRIGEVYEHPVPVGQPHPACGTMQALYVQFDDFVHPLRPHELLHAPQPLFVVLQSRVQPETVPVLEYRPIRGTVRAVVAGSLRLERYGVGEFQYILDFLYQLVVFLAGRVLAVVFCGFWNN